MYPRSSSDDRVLGCVLILILAFIIDLAVSWVLMVVWNWVVPGITGWNPITFWQAFGLSILFTVVGSFFRSSSRT